MNQKPPWNSQITQKAVCEESFLKPDPNALSLRSFCGFIHPKTIKTSTKVLFYTLSYSSFPQTLMPTNQQLLYRLRKHPRNTNEGGKKVATRSKLSQNRSRCGKSSLTMHAEATLVNQSQPFLVSQLISQNLITQKPTFERTFTLLFVEQTTRSHLQVTQMELTKKKKLPTLVTLPNQTILTTAPNKHQETHTFSNSQAWKLIQKKGLRRPYQPLLTQISTI